MGFGIWDWNGNGIWDWNGIMTNGMGWNEMEWAGMGWDSKWVASVTVMYGKVYKYDEEKRSKV